jgi:hypothetical protein
MGELELDGDHHFGCASNGEPATSQHNDCLDGDSMVSRVANQGNQVSSVLSTSHRTLFPSRTNRSVATACDRNMFADNGR